ncbi:T9SS type A sorting domain-containing protein [Flammeovirga sp. EKP202]|uniref:T9SS type A sorting domain-containing protein n=1 Tax=Flammeovirga sp. EKP202 TaxID=2770592 RepID=UPI00165F520E|nr:T9SS type A sorting domain-containing protein [Flammeovirga sp. EKP202]MBD0403924.1 T9SS type A sorting domain-containing protein [Flammeovirga sp. EKP202]
MNSLHLNCLYLIALLSISTSQNVFSAVFEPYVGDYGTAVYNSASDWQNSSNWTEIGSTSSTGYPVSGDQINFGSSTQYRNNAIQVNFNVTDDTGYTGFILESNSYESSITIGNGGNLSIQSLNDNNKIFINVESGGTLSVSDKLILDATSTEVTVGGTLNLDGGLQFGGGGAQIFNNTGTTNVTGDFTMEAGDINITSGSFNISGAWIIPSSSGNGTNAIEVASGASMDVGGGIDFVNQAITGDLDTKIQISGSFKASGCDDSGSSVCTKIEASGGDLPVVLISLFGIQTDDGFLVKWTTASEQNNSHFMIEGSNDKKDWMEIAEIDGQGNTNVATDYEILLTGEQYSYYRLVQYDFDGAFEIFGVLNQNTSNTDSEVKVFPNELVQGQSVNLLFSNIDSDLSLTLQLFDLNGNTIEYYSDRNFSSSFYQFELPNALENGIYFLSIVVGQEKHVQKILVR